jgi:hypothetical protein
VKEMIARYDVDGNGVIDYAEFIKVGDRHHGPVGLGTRVGEPDQRALPVVPSQQCIVV